METMKISYLCKLSDRVYDNAKKAENSNFGDKLRKITLHSNYGCIEIDFDDYPELKQVGEKLLDYLVKSEKSKQNEIKLEIAKLL